MKIKLLGLVITTLLFLISVGFSIMVLTWINKLEATACKCSEDFKRDYIKYYFYVYVSLYSLMYLNAVYMLMAGSLSIFSGIILFIISIVQYILPIFSLLNIIFSIMYIWKLKEIQCACSEDIRREIFYVLSWINVGFMALAVLLVFFTAIVGGAVMASTFSRQVITSRS